MELNIPKMTVDTLNYVQTLHSEQAVQLEVLTKALCALANYHAVDDDVLKRNVANSLANVDLVRILRI